jgi:1-acyl-sn-glycerol-3-phosphate acyltransferase
MPYLRAAGVFSTMILFFVVAAPLQWLILKLSLPGRQTLPLLFNRLLLGFLRIRVSVQREAQENPATWTEAASLPQLLVSNHVSWTDIPALGTLHLISFLAKREVGTWPIIATFAELQGTIFVDRTSRKSIKDANIAMARRMLAGGWVALFPEGTTYDGSELGRFHSSHFAAARELLQEAPDVAAVCVQPVAIRYSSAHAAWLGDDLLLPHVMTLVKREPVTCTIMLGAPILFDRSSDRKAAAQLCTDKIGALLAATEPKTESAL